jgi:hypothetical protein
VTLLRSRPPRHVSSKHAHFPSDTFPTRSPLRVLEIGLVEHAAHSRSNVARFDGGGEYPLTHPPPPREHYGQSWERRGWDGTGHGATSASSDPATQHRCMKEEPIGRPRARQIGEQGKATPRFSPQVDERRPILGEYWLDFFCGTVRAPRSVVRPVRQRHIRAEDMSRRCTSGGA